MSHHSIANSNFANIISSTLTEDINTKYDSIAAIRPPNRFPPLTPQQMDEVMRTIYVGNVNSEVSFPLSNSINI